MNTRTDYSSHETLQGCEGVPEAGNTAQIMKVATRRGTIAVPMTLRMVAKVSRVEKCHQNVLLGSDQWSIGEKRVLTMGQYLCMSCDCENFYVNLYVPLLPERSRMGSAFVG